MASPRTQAQPLANAQTPEPTVDDQASAPTHDEIARLAHSYWLSRKHEDGSAEDDWLRAEKEFRERKTQTA